ncbi:hypothetical protein D3C71_1768980 [compost metagenome]
MSVVVLIRSVTLGIILICSFFGAFIPLILVTTNVFVPAKRNPDTLIGKVSLCQGTTLG